MWIYLLITIHKDLDAISSILSQVFEITPFKRDYDTAFGKIADIIRRYGIIENPVISGLDSLYACKSFLILFLKSSGN